mgnify:CR=1 FL=1
MKKHRMIIFMILIIMLLIPTKSYCDFKETLKYTFSGSGPHPGTASGQKIWCRQKDGHLDGGIEYTYNIKDNGKEPNMNEKLACWLWLLEKEGSNEDIQSVIYNQNGSASKYNVTKRTIARNKWYTPSLTINAEKKYKEMLKIVNDDDDTQSNSSNKHFKMKNKPESTLGYTETGTRKNDILEFYSDSSQPNFYFIDDIVLNFNKDEKNSYISNIELLNEDGNAIELDYKSGKSSSVKFYRKAQNFDDKSYKYKEINGNDDASITLVIPKANISDDVEYKIKITHTYTKTTQEEGYTGAYALYLADGCTEGKASANQMMFSYNVNKQDDKQTVKSNSVIFPIKKGTIKGTGEYVKFIDRIEIADMKQDSAGIYIYDGTYKTFAKPGILPNIQNGVVTNRGELQNPPFYKVNNDGNIDYNQPFKLTDIKDLYIYMNDGGKKARYRIIYKYYWISHGDGGVTIQQIAQQQNSEQANPYYIYDSFDHKHLEYAEGSYHEAASFSNDYFQVSNISNGSTTFIINVDDEKVSHGVYEPAGAFWAFEFRFNLIMPDGDDHFDGFTYNEPSSGPPIPTYPTTNIEGKIFIDGYYTGKQSYNPDGIYNNEDLCTDSVRVELRRFNSALGFENCNWDNSELVDSVVTKTGTYSFRNLPVAALNYNSPSIADWEANWDHIYYYYVRFIYNGQVYETTIYNENTDNICYENTGNFCLGNRDEFNKRYQTVSASNTLTNHKSGDTISISNDYLNSGNSNVADVNAYLMDAGMAGINAYGYRDQTAIVNLGLIKRYFDLNLTTSLESMEVSINGGSQTFKGYGSPTISASISNDDLVDDRLNQKLTVQESDYNANLENGKDLEVWVKYKIKVSNESVAYNGQIGNIRVLFDNRFTAYKVGDGGDEHQLTNSKDYNSSRVVSLNNIELPNNGKVESTNEVDVYMKLDKNTIKSIMEQNNSDYIRTLEFVAEIGSHSSYYKNCAYGKYGESDGYSIQAGKFDEDSIPENFDIKKYNEFGSSKERNEYAHTEDDTDRALGVQLVKGGGRILKGRVFEDATKINSEGARLGDGTYSEKEDKPIEGINVKLIDTTRRNNNTNSVKTDENGEYTISGFIPSTNYRIEFFYGGMKSDDETAKKYNSIDYKSTIDTTGIEYTTINSNNGEKLSFPSGQTGYWYASDKVKNKSVAKDESTNMGKGRTKELKYKNAIELENYYKNSTEDHSGTATTSEFMVPITECGKNSSGKTDYTIENMNLGLAERPRSELTLHKQVDHITITTSDGRTLIDGTQVAINSTSWIDRYVQAIVDENLIYGSTLKITYKYWVENTGELDYLSTGEVQYNENPNQYVKVKSIDKNNSKRKYYDYGEVGEDQEMVTTKADKVIDYVDNKLMYDKEIIIPENAKENKEYWELATDDNGLNILGDNIKEDAKFINTKLITTKLNKELLPKETTDEIYLTLSKVLSSEEDNDRNALVYNNYAEIIQSTNTAGRRSYSIKKEKLLSDISNERGAPIISEENVKEKANYVLSIPGDLNPRTLSTLKYEPDSAQAQEVSIVPPFGSQRAIWTIIATVSTTILAVGIILIKKKVLK